MKCIKFLFVLVLNVFVFGYISGQTITVKNPHGGDTWLRGISYTITWTKSGKMNAKVKIRLYNSNGTVKILGITNNTPNDGSFGPWNLPVSVPDGDYLVRIKTIDNKIFDDGEIFKIRARTKNVAVMQKINPWVLQPKLEVARIMVKPQIGVATPVAGEIVNPAKTYKIIWRSTGVMLNWVNIQAVFVAKNYLYSIVKNTTNDGEFLWNLGKSSWTPGQYKLKIATTDNNVVGYSGVFTIPSKSSSAPCKTGQPALDLECLINKYRKTKGLPPVPHSAALAKVALAHVKDLAKYNLTAKCGSNPLHSWSKNGPWKGGCYDGNDSKTYPVMWLKPKEIAGDPNYGFEIAHQGSSDAAGLLNSWKGSSAHNDVILNRNSWKGYKWIGMGAAIYGGYSVVWFE
jgi:uncharacterized protein YkwD